MWPPAPPQSVYCWASSANSITAALSEQLNQSSRCLLQFAIEYSAQGDQRAFNQWQYLSKTMLLTDFEFERSMWKCKPCIWLENLHTKQESWPQVGSWAIKHEPLESRCDRCGAPIPLPSPPHPPSEQGYRLANSSTCSCCIHDIPRKPPFSHFGT